MNTELIKEPGNSISKRKLLEVVHGLSYGEKHGSEPAPAHGQFDFLFRQALRLTFPVHEVHKEFNPQPVPLGDPAPFFQSAADLRLSFFAASNPAIWDVIGGGRFGLAELNPQPLPPRRFFLRALVETIVERAELLYELGVGTAGEERAIIIVSGYVQRIVDDLCPEPFRFRWPFPWPRPNWFKLAFSELDLVVLAAEFDDAAKMASPGRLSPVLGKASGSFLDASQARS